MKGKKQSKVHLYRFFTVVTALGLLCIMLVGAKSVIKGSGCHAKIYCGIAGKWIKESLMAANATLLPCTRRAGELLLFCTVIFRLNKMQHILQNEKVYKDFQSPSQIWLQAATNWNILM